MGTRSEVVPDQDRHLPSLLQVAENDARVVTPDGKDLPVRSERQATGVLDRQRGQLLACSTVAENDTAAVEDPGDPFAVRGDSQCRDRRFGADAAEQLASSVPQLESLIAPNCQAAVRAKGQCIDHPAGLKSNDRTTQDRAARWVCRWRSLPDAHHAIRTAGGYPLAVRGVGHGPDVCVLTQAAHQLAPRGEVPHADEPILANARQGPTIRAEGQRVRDTAVPQPHGPQPRQRSGW